MQPTVPAPISPTKTAVQNAPIIIEIEEIPTFVNNIVYCRDKKALQKIED
jgi:hypothetical protein